MQLTDDDLVPLALLKVAMEELDRKFEVKVRLWADLISELRSEIEKKKKQIQCTERQKKEISQNVLVTSLNKRLEDRRKEVFTKNYLFTKLFRLMKEQKGIWTSAEDFKEKFLESIELKTGGF